MSNTKAVAALRALLQILNDAERNPKQRSVFATAVKHAIRKLEGRE